ncbi:hypothetical protein GQ600_23589 [Phytophthora cactorum]|nr:hypothetical protein GQ600_23589 [Phytophthora cactorum]
MRAKTISPPILQPSIPSSTSTWLLHDTRVLGRYSLPKESSRVEFLTSYECTAAHGGICAAGARASSLDQALPHCSESTET